MQKADVFRTYLLAQLGEPYVWGEEGPNAHDCSGLVWEAFHAADAKWKGNPLRRLTAHDYWLMSTKITKPERVGDCGFIVNKHGHAVHIIAYAGAYETVEARGKKWGVVRYALNDKINGALKRKARWGRLVDLGALDGRRELKLLDPFMVGEDVEWAQKKLNNILIAGLAIDGEFGPLTQAAVMEFQRSRKLTVDGIVGSRTWAAMDAAV